MARRGPIPLSVVGGSPKGHRTTAEIEERGRTVKARAQRPSQPSTLGRAGKAEWKRIVDELEPLGLLAPNDRQSLFTYCGYVDIWEAAWKEWRDDGRKVQVIGPRGAMVAHPCIAVIAKTEAAMARLAKEFLATPVARLRNTMPIQEEDDDDGLD